MIKTFAGKEVIITALLGGSGTDFCVFFDHPSTTKKMEYEV